MEIGFVNQSERQDAIRSRLDALGACSYPDLAEWLGMPLESIPRLLAGCRAGGYAVGYFESWNLESLQGVLDAAEQTRSLVIVGFNGEFLSGTGRLVPERLALHGALGKAAAESSSVFACLERPMTARHLGIAEALREAIAEEMSRDQRVFCIGEDIAVPGGWGGAFTVTLGLEKKFPDRMINTPIAELGFFGVACGASMAGMRPIADVQYGDFLLLAADQIINNIAKTILAWLLMLHYSLQAAERLAAEGISAEVIDVRSLSPLDLETIGASVRKTGRVVIVEEGPKTGSVGAEIAARVMEECGEYLRCPIRRVASADVPVPFTPVLESAYRPDVPRIVAAADEAMEFGGWLRAVTAGLVLCFILLTGLRGQAEGPLAGVETVCLNREPSGWATRLSDGRLMLWWVEGKSTDAAKVTDKTTTEVAYARFSRDAGCTWSQPEKLFAFPRSEGAYAGSSIFCDRDGVIHLFGIHYFGFNIKGNETAEQLQRIVPGKSPAFHVMSADAGKSWTPPQYCDFGHEYTGSTNGAIQLSQGRILLPLSYLSRRVSGRFVSVVTYSDDGGKTWKPSRGECIVDDISRNIESGAIEPVCVELADQRVWMLIRTKTGYLFQSFSSDHGDTWSTPVVSRFRSTNAPGALLRLRDGRLVMVWNNTHQQTSREVLAAAISDDEGQTWSGYREIVRVNKPKNTKASHYQFGVVTYPYLTEAADGTIIVTFMGAGQTVVRVKPAWLKETAFRDDFSGGLSRWCTLDAEGVASEDWSERAPGSPRSKSLKVLALRSPVADSAAGASLNFPFGVRGSLTARLLFEPGFQGARLCLTDAFSLLSHEEDGRFGIAIGPDGRVSVSHGGDRFTPAQVTFECGKWYNIGLVWDCAEQTCGLSVDSRHVADLPSLADVVTAVTGTYQGVKSDESRFSGAVHAAGICYLRLWSTAKETDRAGLKLADVSVSVRP